MPEENIINTNQINPAELAENEEEKTVRVDKGEYYLEKKDFDGAASGFSFYIIQFKSLAAAIEKYTEATMLALINSAIAFSMRNKAKGRLPKFDDALEQKKAWSKLIAEDKILLLTEEDAEAFKPGERDITPEKLFRQAREAMKQGDKKLAKQLMTQAMELAMQDLDEG